MRLARAILSAPFGTGHGVPLNDDGSIRDEDLAFIENYRTMLNSITPIHDRYKLWNTNKQFLVRELPLEKERADREAERNGTEEKVDEIIKNLRAQELKDKEARKKAAEDRKKNQKEEREKFFKERGATTTAEKQACCLHLDFWPKEQQKQKFKCGDCNKKRSMTGFKCPHCALLVCQLCLQKLNAQRSAM
jgi:hypothetical protein